MILKKVLLHNVGIYAGDNEFVFTGKKPVILIGGINGRGKTTFLEAILLALYGSNSFLFKSKKKTYPQYLRGYINTNDKTCSSYVELEFDLEEDEKACYRLKRSWNAISPRIDEKLIVEKNGQRDTFLENNWSQFFEGILPSGIARFFFFDGEKIAELAEDDSDREVKNSIKALMGISVLDTMEKDLRRVIRKSDRERDNDLAIDSYFKYDEEVRDLEKKREKKEKELDEDEQQKANLLHRIEEVKTEFAVKGGNVVQNRQNIESEVSDYSRHITELNYAYKDLCLELLPLKLVQKQLSRIRTLANKEADVALRHQTLKMMEHIIGDFKSETDIQSEILEDLISFANSKVGNDEIEIDFGLDSSKLANLNDLLNNSLKTAVEKAMGLREEKKQTEEKIAQLQKTLSLDFNERELTELTDDLAELNLELGKIQNSIELLNTELKTLNSQLTEAERKKNSVANQVVVSEENRKENVRIIKYGNMSLEILKTYRERLQGKRIDDLAKTMTNCYEMLRNKKNLICQIKMDPVTLDLKYLGPEGQIVPSESLSAGEKQLMVISLLWALAKSTRRKLPIIIDTPLSRLDSKHRELIVRNYYPNASDQIIILSTDTEITDEYYTIMRPYIDKEYFLDYNEDNKATTVKEGYFSESKYGD